MSKNKEYKALTVPKLTWQKKSLTEKFGELIVQPLEPGFGITLGNAIRRILLGGVEGSAVTSVIIKGINNEFSALSGVVEDAIHVLLNIKDIVIRNTTGKPGKMRAKMSGEGILTVGDIIADDHLELINPEHVIAHVASQGELEIEFFVESGRGYQPAQWDKNKPLQEDGRIFLDAMFSPVRKITFDVEKTRVGGDIDYDKLILCIHTDGSENPLEALHYSVSVLRSQLEYFLSSAEIPFSEISKSSEQDALDDDSSAVLPLKLKGIPVEVLVKPIEELELSVRAHNCLVNSNIRRIVDLVNLHRDEIIKIKNFGRKSLDEVENSLKAFGLSLGMNIKESDLKAALKEG